MKRKHKRYSKPRKAFDAARIKEENEIVRKYGLKNKREIWKAEAKLNQIRKKAKKLVDSSVEEHEKFLGKLREHGFKVNSLVDVLALTKEDILKRRLQTILVRKKLVSTPKMARQLIVHRHVKINERIVDIPSYMVPVKEEDLIRVELTLKNKKEDKIKFKENREDEQH